MAIRAIATLFQPPLTLVLALLSSRFLAQSFR
jgi:hypothetical protein